MEQLPILQQLEEFSESLLGEHGSELLRLVLNQAVDGVQELKQVAVAKPAGRQESVGRAGIGLLEVKQSDQLVSDA